MKDSVKKLRIHIIGTHGVPAKYGGFETLADFLCQYLGKEYEITVYCNSNKYEKKLKEYFGAKLIYLRLDASGFKGIIYDFTTYLYALLKADIILYLCPVTSGFMTPLKYLTDKTVIVNHGGLNEWEREKLSWIQRKWAKFNHSVAARFADINIADNLLYKGSLKNTFNVDSIVIKYGGDHVQKVSFQDEILSKKYSFLKERYAVSVSRAQLDNNLHLVLEAFEHFKDYKIVLISNWNVSKYGRDLKQKYSNHSNMVLLDAIYDQRELDYIRGNAYVYIHSHSRCGTSPSLVEAMCLKQAILSYDVPTNRETTKGEAVFFQDANSLENLLSSITEVQVNNLKSKLYLIAMKEYTWKEISQNYSNVINAYKKLCKHTILSYFKAKVEQYLYSGRYKESPSDFHLKCAYRHDSLIEMQVLSSGSLSSKEVIEFPDKFPQIKSVLYEASFKENIQETIELIEENLHAPLTKYSHNQTKSLRNTEGSKEVSTNIRLLNPIRNDDNRQHIIS